MSRMILYAEDDLASRGLVVEELVRLGYAVDTAADGEEAILRLTEKSYDLVLLDIKMPKKTGLDVLTYLKDNGLKPRVIMLTGVGELSIAIRSMKLGANEYITKPFKLEELTGSIEKVLKR